MQEISYIAHYSSSVVDSQAGKLNEHLEDKSNTEKHILEMQRTN